MKRKRQWIGGALCLTLVVTAAAVQPAPAAAQPTPAALQQAEKLLRAVGIIHPWLAKKNAAKALASGLTEQRVIAMLGRLWASCLASNKPCKDAKASTAGSPGQRQQKAVRSLLGLLGEMGTARAFSLLWRADERRVSRANSTRQRVLVRLMKAAQKAHPCHAPAPVEVAAARKGLAGFLTVRALGARLVARQPTGKELDDLAYFLAAANGAGAVVGSAREQGVGSWRRPGTRNRRRTGLYRKLGAARMRGDLATAERLARRYLQTLGYPGPIHTAREHNYSFGGPVWAQVMRDLALLVEARGGLAEAARLYRRAPPGGGACGTGDSFRWEEQVKGAIRTGERLGRCRSVVPERLLELERKDYGTSRLAAAGFDVPRLYRGALVTRNRDLKPARLRAILEAAPARLRGAALARLDARGAEAWERRVFAVEGLADSAQRAALPLLTDLALKGAGAVRLRALKALGRLIRRPERDPCAPGLYGNMVSTWSSVWSRSIQPLGQSCKTHLSPPQSAGLARKLLPLLKAPQGAVRAAAARALGQLAHASARRPLEPLQKDPYQAPGVRICHNAGKGPCTASYPVRKAAREALARIHKVLAREKMQHEPKKAPHGKSKKK